MSRATTELFAELKTLITNNSRQIDSLSEVVLKKSDLDKIMKTFETAIAKKDVEIAKMHDRLAVAENAIEQIKLNQNQAEQYSRRTSLRLMGVQSKER